MNIEEKTILVVDDTPENIDVIRGVLGNTYKIKVALHGKKALSLIENGNPDLILLDIMMPEMDGYDVCRYLKSHSETQSIPIIFLTAKSEATDESYGFELGAVDYITKPISPIVLRARVKTHLALSDQALHLEELVKARTQEVNDTRLKIIQKLCKAAEFKDNETGLHVIRMSMVSYLIAKAAGLSDSECEMILHSSPMHDIGKIGIPDKILLKAGPLDDEEWQVMRNHPYLGAQILGDDESPLLNMANTVALTHHEKWDGSGYPQGLVGEEIPIEGRIVAIADVFDALVSKRPYKDPWPIEKAVELIKSEAGKHFDPVLVPAFLEILDEAVSIQQRYSD